LIVQQDALRAQIAQGEGVVNLRRRAPQGQQPKLADVPVRVVGEQIDGVVFVMPREQACNLAGGQRRRSAIGQR